MGEDGELGLPRVVKDCIAVVMIEGQSESLTLGIATDEEGDRTVKRGRLPTVAKLCDGQAAAGGVRPRCTLPAPQGWFSTDYSKPRSPSDALAVPRRAVPRCVAPQALPALTPDRHLPVIHLPARARLPFATLHSLSITVSNNTSDLHPPPHPSRAPRTLAGHPPAARFAPPRNSVRVSDEPYGRQQPLYLSLSRLGRRTGGHDGRARDVPRAGDREGYCTGSEEDGSGEYGRWGLTGAH